MSALTRWSSQLESFDARGRLFAAGRSLLGAAQLSILLANPERLLFGATPWASGGSLCRGVNSLTLWCAAGSGKAASSIAELVACTVLVGVICGLWPRWLCVPHWYITFSMSARITASNGGDAVAEILAMLLFPYCLGDRRVWHWQRPVSGLEPVWRGISCAAHLVLRCQVVIIYVNAAISKLSYPAWRDGTALRTVLMAPGWNVPPGVRGLIEPLLSISWAGTAMTWGAVATEFGIAAATLGSPRIRRGGLVLAVCLHAAIILTLGLFSFGLIMIALVMIAAESGQRSAAPHVPADHGLGRQISSAWERI